MAGVNFASGEYLTLRSTTTTSDPLGDSSETTVEREWGPCAVWDRFAQERTDPSVAPVVVGLMIAGPRVEIDSDDEIVRDDVTYAVDGLPQINTVNPFTGWDPGIVVPVKRAGRV